MLLEHTASLCAVSRATLAKMGTSRARVMAVDDEPRTLGFYRRALLEDCDLVTIGDAREALRRIVEGERFDVILSDLVMPAMSGDAFYAEVLRVAPAQAEAFVFLTSGAPDDASQSALDDTGVPVLIKPFSLQDLRTSIQDARARRAKSGA